MGIVITGYSNVAITYIIGNWFQEKNGFAMGITMSCSGLGGAIFNPVLSAAIEAFGWRAAYLTAAGFVLLLTLPGVLLSSASARRIRGFCPTARQRACRLRRAGRFKRARLLSAARRFLVTAVFSVLVYAVSGFNAHVSGFATSIGLAPAVGALMVSASMIGNVVFKLLIGVLSDAFGAPKACGVIDAAQYHRYDRLCIFAGWRRCRGDGERLFLRRHLCGIGGRYPARRALCLWTAAARVAYSYISLFACISSSCTMAGFGYSYDLFGTYRVYHGITPRMRGKVRPPTASFQLSGITPAYAGKSESEAE